MHIKEITSATNERVKRWSQLSGKKGRDAQGRFIAEGALLVQEALQSGAGVETVVFDREKGAPDWLRGFPSVEAIAATSAVIEKCTDTDSPQGVFAVCAMGVEEPKRLLELESPLVVAADGIADPGNLGALIRSADAVGAGGVLLGEGTVDAYNPKVIRSSMGSIFHLPVVRGPLQELLAQANKQGIRLVGASLQGTASCYEYDFTQPTWIVLGNEAKGISPQTADTVDTLVKIPMPGRAESLNVAMAGTVLLFEAMRQRIHV